MKNIIYSILKYVCRLSLELATNQQMTLLKSPIYFCYVGLKGDEKIVFRKGQPFVEPGYYAEMNGEDITESVQITCSIDISTPGIYNLVCGIQRGRHCENIYT
ncbi:DUF5011 domain-containing protein [Bacteroides thetaiotaomicron]|nr:DUF5011 domain-containing protein [Bacteroides thetaiotaomicron]